MKRLQLIALVLFFTKTVSAQNYFIAHRGASYLAPNLYYRIINPRVISSAEQLNIEVLTWTVDKPQTVRKLNNMGINKITTNRPLWLKEQLQK